jgi:hypothetical protein
MEVNDECYCDFESRRFFGSKETAHDPLCPQYESPEMRRRKRLEEHDVLVARGEAEPL